MVSQRGTNAFSQRLSGDLITYIEDNCSISFELELLWKLLAKRLDQIGLAMKVYGILGGIRLFAIDANRRTAFRFLGDVSRLTPLECLLYWPDALGGCRNIKDKLAENHHLSANWFWIRVENFADVGILEAFQEYSPAQRFSARKSFGVAVPVF